MDERNVSLAKVIHRITVNMKCTMLKYVKPKQEQVSSEIIHRIFVHIVKGLASDTPKCDSLEYDMRSGASSKCLGAFRQCAF